MHELTSRERLVARAAEAVIVAGRGTAIAASVLAVSAVAVAVPAAVRGISDPADPAQASHRALVVLAEDGTVERRDAGDGKTRKRYPQATAVQRKALYATADGTVIRTVPSANTCGSRDESSAGYSLRARTGRVGVRRCGF